MNSVIIETKNLSKKFGELVAVDDLNIFVRRGQIVGFLGPNGAGKTTTINMLSTITKPSSGEALIEEFSVNTKSSEVKRHIGLCPQELIFYEYLTAQENAEFFAKMHNIPKDLTKTRIKILFKKLGLEDKLNARASTLSGGMKRRLNVILSLIMDPSIVFFDEPSAGLDPQSARLTYDFIRSLRDEGKTIILTTHNMREAEELSDYIYIIDHGKVLVEGTPQSLRANFGQGEVIDMKFKEFSNGFSLTQLKSHIEELGDFIKQTQILSETRLIVSATGGIKRLFEIERLLPGGLESLENLNIRSNNLEDVFLFLTGRQLRE